MVSEHGFRLPRLFWIGFWIAAAGSAPLLVFLIADALGFIADPNPNPIGLGLLFFVSFWPGVAVMALGAALGALRWLRAG